MRKVDHRPRPCPAGGCWKARTGLPRGDAQRDRFDDEALSQPQAMVSHGWIETMPCNYNQARAGVRVKDGVREPEAPDEVDTIAISDGVPTDGHRGGTRPRSSAATHRQLDRARRPGALLRRPLLHRRRQDDLAGAMALAVSTDPASSSTAQVDRLGPGAPQPRPSPTTSRRWRGGGRQDERDRAERNRGRHLPGRRLRRAVQADTMAMVMEVLGLPFG